MSSSEVPNFDSITMARQIIDLNAEVYREVNERHYERAAALRDQREALQRKLNEWGDPTVAKNVTIALKSWSKGPALALLENVESAVDPELLQVFNAASLPPRWILKGRARSCRATLAECLRIESLDSAYFRTQLPVFSSAALAKATHPMEWLTASIRETARATSPVVWIVQEPAYLAERGLLDVTLQVLRVESTQFVVCLGEADTGFAAQFAAIPAVSAVGE